MFREMYVENGIHIYGFLVKKQPIRETHPDVLIRDYPPPGTDTNTKIVIT